jgi:hypothetical protein
MLNFESHSCPVQVAELTLTMSMVGNRLEPSCLATSKAPPSAAELRTTLTFRMTIVPARALAPPPPSPALQSGLAEDQVLRLSMIPHRIKAERVTGDSGHCTAVT